jgi:predicted dinucleotide-binding enzyme
MRIGVLGTGIVGRTVGGKLAELGHEVMVGTRDPDALMARTQPDAMGSPAFPVWHTRHQGVLLGTFEQAAAHGALVVNATSGIGSLEALGAAGEKNLDGKLLIDVANPLDYSGGMPPTLSVCNTDSLGEQIQRAFPGARVVKTLNTVNTLVMVEPALVPGDHAVFVCGNDPDAKAEVSTILRDWFGWRQVIDIGDITAARAAEMYLPLWLRLLGRLGHPIFNVAVVTQKDG